MEVWPGGGDKYKAYGYPVPSTGAVHGGSSTELLDVLCGYWFHLFVSGFCWPALLAGLSGYFLFVFSLVVCLAHVVAARARVVTL